MYYLTPSRIICSKYHYLSIVQNTTRVYKLHTLFNGCHTSLCWSKPCEIDSCDFVT